MKENQLPQFPITEWIPLFQAAREAAEAGRKLEPVNLAKDCRQRFGPAGLAALVTAHGVIIGASAEEYSSSLHKGGRSVWLIHRSALEQRLAERARGPGNPTFRQPGQPGIPKRGGRRKDAGNPHSE